MSTRVLVVEDNLDNLNLVRYLLEAHDYETIVATSGEQGVALAVEHRPDIILMDIQMPGIDGYEARERIRSHPELRRTPVIAVTAFAMVGDHERMMTAGFQGCITKPIAPQTFVDEVRGFVEAASSA